jgi:hypothetical protein
VKNKPVPDMSNNKQDIRGNDNITAGNRANVRVEKHDHKHYHYSTTQTPQVDIDEVAILELFDSLPTDTIPLPTPIPAGSRIEYGVNPAFVGRDAALCKLAVALKGADVAAIGQVTGVTGLGGIGKSQLASEFAHRYGQYFAGGVFWLNCEQADNMENEFMACAVRLIDDPQVSDAMNPGQLSEITVSAWQQSIPRLLIFDNCEDPAVLDQWKPKTGGCRVLVTSRKSHWRGIETLSLDVLDRADSITLLIHARSDLASDDPDLDTIADELGDLPLALHLAGHYLETYRDDDIGRPPD